MEPHPSHEEPAAAVEDLGIVRTLGQRLQPEVDRLLLVALLEVQLGQRVSQRARVGTRSQQVVAQRCRFLKPKNNTKYFKKKCITFYEMKFFKL